jgi:hypothetical protein
MMLRDPKTKDLYEGPAQKSFGVLILDGSPFPPGSTALPRSLPGHSAQEVERGEAFDDYRDQTLWIKKQTKTKENQRQPTTIEGQAGSMVGIINTSLKSY